MLDIGRCSLVILKNLLITILTADQFFAGYDDHAATHLKGLQTLVSLRGGLEKGNFDRYTKFNLAGYVNTLPLHAV